jgi:hypothetical protein
MSPSNCDILATIAFLSSFRTNKSLFNLLSATAAARSWPSASSRLALHDSNAAPWRRSEARQDMANA